MNKKTIVQINSVCGVGSTGRIATDIHKNLKKQGYTSYIAYGRGNSKNIDAEDTIKIGNRFSQFMHLVKTRVLDRHGFGSKRATKKFIKKLKIINPDIIHIHNLHGYYINIRILFTYLKKANVKVVWTLHDCWSFTGHSAYFDYPKIEGWDDGIHKCGGKYNYPRSILRDSRIKNSRDKKNIFSSIDNMTIITPSVWLKELVEKSFLNKYEIQVINNGIDLSKFTYKENDFKSRNGLSGYRLYLGVSNIWDDRKGLEFFLDFSKELTSDEKIVLVGLTISQIENLPENIMGINRTDSIEELVEIYSSADVFLNPTKEDNYPTVNLEAQACGLPVITLNTGGSPESAAVEGYIVENHNDMAKKARDKFIHNRKKNLLDGTFNIDHFSKKYIEIYES